MAKNLVCKRTICDQVTLKGVMSDDGTTISYMEKVEDIEIEKTVTIKKFLDMFAGLPVNISIKAQEENELEVPDDTDEDDSDEN